MTKNTDPRFCNNCSFLNITEEEQDKQKNKERHFCNRYIKVLLHNGYHPRIPVLTECDYTSSKQLEVVELKFS